MPRPSVVSSFPVSSRSFQVDVTYRRAPRIALREFPSGSSTAGWFHCAATRPARAASGLEESVRGQRRKVSQQHASMDALDAYAGQRGFGTYEMRLPLHGETLTQTANNKGARTVATEVSSDLEMCVR